MRPHNQEKGPTVPETTTPTTPTTPTLKDLDDAIEAVQKEKNSAAALKTDPAATPEQFVAAHDRISAAIGNVHKVIKALEEHPTIQARHKRKLHVASLGEIITLADSVTADARSCLEGFRIAGIE
jgi:hypothetical protein